MKCEICGENEAKKDPERCTITVAEWFICDTCSRFFKQVEKELCSSEGGNDYFDFSHDEMEDENE